MELMLEIISRHKFGHSVKPAHIFSEVGGVIGRSATCEWCLTDKNRRISRKHAVITCDGKRFYIEDKSSNGIFSPLTKELVARGRPHAVEHGESFIIGEYTIQARLLHKPDAYLQPSAPLAENILPDDARLDLDPLVAMEQQDDFIARERLGLRNGLLHDASAPVTQTADHSAARLDTLPAITAIPENWADISAPFPRPLSPAVPGGPLSSVGNGGRQGAEGSVTAFSGPPPETPLGASEGPAAEPGGELAGGSFVEPFGEPPEAPANPLPPVNMFHPLAHEHPRVAGNPGPDPLPGSRRPLAAPWPETDVFFKALGFSAAPETQEERERVLLQAADLLLVFVNSLQEALHNRADTQNELRLPVTTVRMAGNNPLKFCPTAAGALEYLLGPEQPDMLCAIEAARAGFADLHAHNLGLLAGARAAVRGVLQTISPESVEAKLDADGAVRMRRVVRLWHTYSRMHQHLLRDSEGFAAFFFNDFSRAYAMQRHTLHPYPANTSKGDK